MTDDETRFGATLTTILNHGALNVAIAIGHRTGLFDTLEALEAPATAAHIAAAAGLNTRYVREWLGVMSAGDIVEIADDTASEDTYRLPAAHAAWLTRRAGNRNMAIYAQEIPLLTSCALEAVIEGFRSGRGVTYDHYPRFQAWMTEVSNAKHRQVLLDTFLPSVDEGRLEVRLRTGIRVCDLGCGEGVALLLMAARFPESRFLGVDIDAAAIATARREAARQELANLRFEVADAARLDGDAALGGAFDYVMSFDAIHDQTRPLEALRGARHLLAPDGLFSMVDIAADSRPSANRKHPMGPFLYTVSLLHCLPVGLVDGGAGLGMMWGRRLARELLDRAGFTRVRVVPIPDDPFNDHYECRV